MSGSTCCPIHNLEHLGGMCGVQQLKIQCGLKDAILLGGMDLFDATYVRWVEPQLFRFCLNCFVSASIASFLFVCSTFTQVHVRGLFKAAIGTCRHG